MVPQSKIWDNEYRNNKKWNFETILPKILKDKKVLELGVGNGKTLKSILKQYPKKVVAIDFSKEAINQCKKSFKNNKIEFLKTDVKNLSYECEFDIIMCHYILNNMMERERELAVKKIFRALKKGGKIIFEDFSVGDFREEEFKNEIEPHTTIKKNGILCHFFDIKELRGLFKDFKKAEFKKKVTSPITHKPNLKRKIIRGIINK